MNRVSQHSKKFILLFIVDEWNSDRDSLGLLQTMLVVNLYLLPLHVVKSNRRGTSMSVTTLLSWLQGTQRGYTPAPRQSLFLLGVEVMVYHPRGLHSFCVVSH